MMMVTMQNNIKPKRVKRVTILKIKAAMPRVTTPKVTTMSINSMNTRKKPNSMTKIMMKRIKKNMELPKPQKKKVPVDLKRVDMVKKPI